MVGIYKITSPSKRVYIGQSIDIFFRWKSYRMRECKTQTKLNNSFKKYGVDNHKFEVIKECKESELNEYERYYQDKYNSCDNGLNCRLTSTNDKSGRMCDETKEKLSVSRRKRVLTDEHKRKISLNHSRHMLGKKHKPESIIKMSENRKGVASRLGAKLSLETKEKIAQKAFGRKATDETKLKMSNTRKNNSQTKILLNPFTGIFYMGYQEAADFLGIKVHVLRYEIKVKKSQLISI